MAISRHRSGIQSSSLDSSRGPGSGIHIVTLPARTHVPVHVDQVADTDYATTLAV